MLQVAERVQQSRARHQRAGLKRIEVLAPEDQVHLVKAYAAQLREGSQSEALGRVRKLVAKAYRKFRARCLDNIQVDPASASFSDAMIVAAALIHRGNSEAYKLGRRIQDLAR